MAKGWAILWSRYDEMKIDKYFIKRGYSNNRFRVVRVKVNKFLDEDFDIIFYTRQKVIHTSTASEDIREVAPIPLKSLGESP